MEDYSAYFQQGYRVCRDGGSRLECPYNQIIDSYEYEEWNEGYYHAESEFD